MTRGQQWLCLACGPLYLVIFGTGWILSGFLPPPLPTADAATIAAFYRDNAFGVRFGQALISLAAGLQVPWAALIATQMRRIPGCSREMVYTALGAGAAGSVFFTLPSLIWMTATFRPERDPQLTWLLSDLGWFFFVPPVTLAMVQVAAFGIGILSDRSARPLFPRWLGYYNLWLAFIFSPGAIISFFKTGPFAWNGLLTFWIPATAFFTWFIVMAFLLRNAIRREDMPDLGGKA